MTSDNSQYYEFIPTDFKYKQKDVYYAEFNSLLIANALVDKKVILSGDLINFHDVTADYLNNRPDKNNVLTFNR